MSIIKRLVVVLALVFTANVSASPIYYRLGDTAIKYQLVCISGVAYILITERGISLTLYINAVDRKAFRCDEVIL